MSAVPENIKSLSLTEVLRELVEANETGFLKIQEGGHEGIIVMGNGMILNAKTGSYSGLHALFQFVGWQEAQFDFRPHPVPDDLARDLAVYDPRVLIEGVAFKEEELILLRGATPALDSVPHLIDGVALDEVEATPADRGLLLLADGHRTVRDIAEMVKLSPLEVARILARFRLAGALKVVNKRGCSKSALAGAG